MFLFVAFDTSEILQPLAVASEVPDDSSLSSSGMVRTICPLKFCTQEDIYDVMFPVVEGCKFELEECGILRRIFNMKRNTVFTCNSTYNTQVMNT